MRYCVSIQIYTFRSESVTEVLFLLQLFRHSWCYTLHQRDLTLETFVIVSK